MDLSELFGALSAPGTEDELAHADTAVAAMVAAHAQSAGVVVPLRSVNRRPALVAVGSVLGVMGAVLLTGTAAAAFSGALPENLQRIAHEVLGAPAPTPLGPDSSSDGTDGTEGSADGTSSRGQSEFTDTPSSNGSGPAATLDAKALLGLCIAFADNGPDDQSGESVAFKVLSEAASANDQTIEEYCAPILATKSPGKPTAAPGKPTSNPGATTKPTAAPGRTNAATTPPGSTRKPTAQTVGPDGRPSTPPQQTRAPSTSGR
ncbi:hypothetical protein [Longivirga aurantiaca]|uniref:Uncharacterized protein n=1 Tax=Longivirga aurantiaca TaxID=1837743 RepID=A0ABW1SXI0_9ACTN